MITGIRLAKIFYRFVYCACMGILCLASPVYAQNANAPAAPPVSSCALQRSGDCCTVTLSSTQPAIIATGFNSGAQTDYVVIVNKGLSNCVFMYDGAMKVLMRSTVGDFNGTWIGDNFALRYQSDETNQGVCLLDIYHMTIGHDIPDTCRSGHFDSALSKHPEPERMEQEHAGQDAIFHAAPPVPPNVESYGTEAPAPAPAASTETAMPVPIGESYGSPNPANAVAPQEPPPDNF